MVLVLGNYLLGTLCLVANQSLELLIRFLSATRERLFLGISYDSLANFVAHGQLLVVLLLYGLLLFFFYKKTTLRIKIPEDPVIRGGLYLVVVPLAITSVLMAFLVALFGIGVFDPQVLQQIVTPFTNNPALLSVFGLFPVWILLHGLITVILTCEVSLSFKSESL